MTFAMQELTDNELLRSIWAALRRMEERLAEPLVGGPTVEVAPPDLTDIVTAVLSLNGTGPTAEDIARAIAESLHFPSPEPDESLAKVASALEKVSNQLKGINSMGGGGGSVNLTPEASSALADLRHGVTDYEIRLDYAGRTDGQPVYLGRAANGSASSLGAWNIEFLTYDVDGNIVRKQVLTGAWDNRAALAW